ncbi:MAG: hypothetical protein EP343_13930 [Deltaproteobacteria bacterium]|nr:MAG: hypothetical protein EP343_13930 [Deltaproteobacteria bacterium]
MSESLVVNMWERARQGESSVVMGLSPSLNVPEDIVLVRVNCAFPWTVDGPLHQAYRLVQVALGGGDVSRGETSLKDGELRHQLLGEMPLQLLEQGFAAACNRLAEANERTTVLLFEAADHADSTVKETLLHLLKDKDTLKIPWIVGFHHHPENSELLDALRETLSEDVFLGQGESKEVVAFDWKQLPPSALRILRAGSVVGHVFESHLVAQLLTLTHQEVLEGLQLAADCGAPLGDYGNNRFFLPPSGVRELQSQMLPSLLSYWHENLASLLALPPEPEVQASSRITWREEPYDQAEPSERMDEEGARHPNTETMESWEEDVPKEAQAPDRDSMSFGELFVPESQDDLSIKEEGPDLGEPEGQPESSEAQGRWLGQEEAPWQSPLVQESSLQKDRLRAASHLQSAGRFQDALLMFLEVAQEASATGQTRQGIFATQQAIAMLGKLPRSRQRTLLEAHILIEMARLKWHGTVSDNTFTLQDALQTLETAKSILPDDAPSELLGQWAATYAGISHDLGDLSLVKQALAELTQVSRVLLAADKPVEAARLLNDQAALYIRLGDSLRASRQLYQSRELFEGILRRDKREPIASEELAHTEHLLARLPLHARIYPDREKEAYTLALGHTERADKLFGELGMAREQARVWATQGKLEMGRGELDAAEDAFLQAMQMQQELGDWTGLARTSAALSDLFVARGQVIEALALLGESTVLNLEKGAPIGVAFNRRAMEELRIVLQKQDAHLLPGVHEQLEQLETVLEHAESILGRVKLPKDSRDGLLHATS